MHVAKDLVAASATPMVLGILLQGRATGTRFSKRQRHVRRRAVVDSRPAYRSCTVRASGVHRGDLAHPTGGRRRKYTGSRHGRRLAATPSGQRSTAR